MRSFALGVLVLLVITFSNSYSQSVYVKLGGGYGLGLATQVMYDAGISPAYDYKYGTYGEGINFQGGLGYNINPNIAFELAGSYTMGKKFEFSTGEQPTTTYKQYANTISIIPSAIIKAPMKSITPYLRLGMVIGIPTKFLEMTESGTNAHTGTFKSKEYGNLALGVQGAGGVNFKASKQLGFFAEIFAIGMNYGPGTWENTETFTGMTLQKTVTYSESGTYVPGGTSDPTQRYAFSSFGMNVGLTYTFGK
jgi:hypothetical protein